MDEDTVRSQVGDGRVLAFRYLTSTMLSSVSKWFKNLGREIVSRQITMTYYNKGTIKSYMEYCRRIMENIT